MRLNELEPRWYTLELNGPIIGISFDCPHCKLARLGIAFHHQGHEQMEDTIIKLTHPNSFIWNITGDNFENISFSPSIDASKLGHWHGWIKEGNVT